MEMKSTFMEMKSTFMEMKSISLFQTPFKPFVVARFKKVLKPYKSL